MRNWEQWTEETLNVSGIEYCFSEPMRQHTTFRIGGPARVFARPSDDQQLRLLLKYCREANVPYMVLGNGSNLLVSDEGYDGMVISLNKAFSGCSVSGNCLKAGGGLLLGTAARRAQEASLAGMEFAAGIPGTVGGALVMNAGAYGSEIKDILKSAAVMTPEGRILHLDAKDLELGYRRSCIPQMGYIVMEAEFELMTGDQEAIGARMRELALRRREKQPLEYPSAGSTFKRPEGYFAGKLIEEAGLKGACVGDAQVSEKHCGFVINRGNAAAEDVMELCRRVQKQVEETFGVRLEMEVKRLGRFKQQ